MSEWRRVTKASEVRNGQRMRYYDGYDWESGSCRVGEEGDERFVQGRDAVDGDGDLMCDDLFNDGWDHVEALFDDAAPTSDRTIADAEAFLASVTASFAEVAPFIRAQAARIAELEAAQAWRCKNCDCDLMQYHFPNGLICPDCREPVAAAPTTKEVTP